MSSTMKSTLFLAFLLSFAHTALAAYNLLAASNGVHPQNLVTYATISNFRVSFDAATGTLELNVDLTALLPDVYITEVGLTLLIDGNTYQWQKPADGTSCVIDPSLCPLPLHGSARVHEVAKPSFTIPDYVFNRPDPIGTFTLDLASTGEGFGEVSGSLTHKTFTPGGAAGASGHSTPVAWISGIATLGLMAAAGAASLLGGAANSLPAAAGAANPFPVTHGPAISLPATSAAAASPSALYEGSGSGGGATVVGLLLAAGGAQAAKGAISGVNAPHGMGGDAAAHNIHAPDASVAKATAHNVHAPHTSNANTTSPNAHHPDAQVTQAHTGGIDHGPPMARMDPLLLFFQFQYISTTGLLSLNYPLLYQGFTVNFAWANFILPIPSFVRSAASNRKCQLPESFGGIASYATQLGIDQQEIFSVSYSVFLCICAIFLGLFLLIHLVLQIKIMQATDDYERKQVWVNRRTRWQQIMSNNSLRLMNLGLGSLISFVFFQWTQRCTSSAVAFASVTALFLVVGSLGFVTFLILRKAKSPGGIRELFSKETGYARRWRSLYDTLNETKLPFIAVLLGSSLLRRAIVGFVQKSGLAQNILMILLEGAMCVVLFKYKPYYSQGYNKINYMLGGAHVLSQIFLLPFNPKFGLSFQAAHGLAIAHILLQAAVLTAVVVLTVIKLGWGILWGRVKHVVFGRVTRPKLGGRKTGSSGTTDADVEKMEENNFVHES